MSQVEGKIALVSGGARGIGLCCVKELLRNGSQGVAVIDVNAEEGNEAVKGLAEEFGANKVIFIRTDVTKPDQFEAAFKQTVQKWQRLDIVVNSAGVFNDEQWELSLAINCGGVIRGTLLGFQYMGKDRCGNGGIVINMSSTLSFHPHPGCPIYVGTKFFINGFDQSLGTPYHYNRTGVKVITLCPGYTTTGLTVDHNKQCITSLDHNIGEFLKDELATHYPQMPENVGKGVITAITKGDNGSIWIAHKDEPAFQTETPNGKISEKP